MSKRTEPGLFTSDPEIELILAVYRRARLDLIYARGKWQRDAEVFLRNEGFNLEAVRAAWLWRRSCSGGRGK